MFRKMVQVQISALMTQIVDLKEEVPSVKISNVYLTHGQVMQHFASTILIADTRNVTVPISALQFPEGEAISAVLLSLAEDLNIQYVKTELARK